MTTHSRMRDTLAVLALVIVTLAMVNPMPMPAVAMGLERDIDLSDASASYLGPPNGVIGWSLAGLGDVNGDGYGDLIIGTPGNGADWQPVYLVLGSSSGFQMDIDISEHHDTYFWSEAPGEGAGSSVAAAGDVNGDGYGDILIGAPGNDKGGPDAGQTYLVLGRPSGWTGQYPLNESDASFIGVAAGDESGQSVAGAGDVNGDGYDDILIGSPDVGEDWDRAGRTYLVLGKPSGWSMDTNLSTADTVFIGEQGADESGCSVAGAGDVNGDGFDDILIGAGSDFEGTAGAGKASLVLGRSDGWPKVFGLSNADASFLGERGASGAGRSVAGAGDVNGDGLDDILIGAYGDDEAGRNTGQTYLVLGRDTGWSMGTGLSSSDASFLGEREGDVAGYPVAGAGDVDGDGYDDILIGARYNDDGGETSGKAYLVMGNASGWRMDVPLSEAAASFVGEGEQAFAGNVAWGGDVNGDGRDDVLIGAHGNEEGGKASGQVYLVFIDAYDSDVDDDGDGYPNPVDAFPQDPAEWNDTDLDGTGDNADPDDDGDEVADALDAFPLDPAEWNDTDLDGEGDNADPDDDGDDVTDENDAFPLDPMEWNDADGDGTGDNADPDDDGDGVPDEEDAFPLDPEEQKDSDGDGIGDNADPVGQSSGLLGDPFLLSIIGVATVVAVVAILLMDKSRRERDRG